MNKFLFFSSSLLLCCLQPTSSKNPSNLEKWNFEKQDDGYVLYRVWEQGSTSQNCDFNAADYTAFVDRFLNSDRSKPEVSLIQYSIVNGFKQLFIWTQHWYRKIKYDKKFKYSENVLSLSGEGRVNTGNGTMRFQNVTVVGYENRNETFFTNTTDSNCFKTYKATYETHFKNLTFHCHLNQNNQTIKYVFHLHNINLTITNLKTRQNNGRILTYPLKETIKFTNYTQNPPILQEPQISQFLSPYLAELLNTDPNNKFKYVSLIQDLKIAEHYKKHVLWLISTILQEYINSNQFDNYTIPKSYLSQTRITFLKIQGLSESEDCVPELVTRKQDDHIFVNLKFSFNFPEEGNKTAIILKTNSSNPMQMDIKILTIYLEFKAPINEKPSLNFNLNYIGCEVIEFDASNLIQNYKPLLTKIFDNVLKDKLLPWYLYDTN